VVDDRIQHRAAVGDPLERDEDAWSQVGPTLLATRPLDHVDGEERQVAGHEHGEQDAEYLYNVT